MASPRIRTAVALLVACAATGAAAPQAIAATTVLDTAPGIAHAAIEGDRVVWIRPEPTGERVLERRRATTRVLAVLPPGDLKHDPLRTESFEASRSLVAVERKAGTPEDAPRGVRVTLELIGRDGRVRRLSNCPGRRCACASEDLLDSNTQFDVDGDRLAYGGRPCERRATRVIDTSPALRTIQRLPEAGWVALRAAGRFLAWSSSSSEALRPSVWVFDRRLRRLAYRWRIPASIRGRFWTLDSDVDAAGRLAVRFYSETPAGSKQGFGFVGARTQRLRRLGAGDVAVEWVAAGRLVARGSRRVVVHDVPTNRTQVVRLAPGGRTLVDADDRCLLYRRAIPTTGGGGEQDMLALEPLPGAEPSPLCP